MGRNLKEMTVAVLKVARTNEMGAFLDAGTGSTSDDVLLHKLQQTRPVAVGETLKVFLYKDPSGRLTASMHTPRMREGQIARASVINRSKVGAFVDVGAERGIFMPFAGMKGRVSIGDKVWVKLYTDKSGRLAVTMDVADEMRRVSRPAVGVERGDTLHGTIYNCTEAGFFILTDEHFIAFLDNEELIERPKVGEEISMRVTFVRDDGRINVSARPLKEQAMESDAERILAFLQTRNGKMPYSDTTPPEIIKDKFNISKSAFKRALGQLLKAGQIEQRDGWTFLKTE